jgi:hypothetical protein
MKKGRLCRHWDDVHGTSKVGIIFLMAFMSVEKHTWAWGPINVNYGILATLACFF